MLATDMSRGPNFATSQRMTSSMMLLHMHTVDKGCLGVAEKGNTTVIFSAVLSLIMDNTGTGSVLRCHNGCISALLVVLIPVYVQILVPIFSFPTVFKFWYYWYWNQQYLFSPMIQVAPPQPPLPPSSPKPRQSSSFDNTPPLLSHIIMGLVVLFTQFSFTMLVWPPFQFT